MADYDIEPRGNSVLRMLHAENPQLGQMFRTFTIAAYDADPPCRQSPELWWDDDKQAQKLAVEACNRCPIKQMCGDWAIAAREREGVWGAMTAKERALIQRKLSKQRKFEGTGEPEKAAKADAEEALRKRRWNARKRADALLKTRGRGIAKDSVDEARAIIAQRRRNSKNWGKGVEPV